MELAAHPPTGVWGGSRAFVADATQCAVVAAPITASTAQSYPRPYHHNHHNHAHAHTRSFCFPTALGLCPQGMVSRSNCSSVKIEHQFFDLETPNLVDAAVEGAAAGPSRRLLSPGVS